jgi:nucleobase:cation symporter-1, NCS1 family
VARLVGKPDVVSLVSERQVNYSAVLVWFSGVVTYHALANLAPAYGAAIPTLVLTFLAAKLTSDKAIAQRAAA